MRVPSQPDSLSRRLGPWPTGYEGRYTNKMGKVREGSATFWRASRLREVARHDVLLRDVFREVGLLLSVTKVYGSCCLMLGRVASSFKNGNRPLASSPSLSGRP